MVSLIRALTAFSLVVSFNAAALDLGPLDGIAPPPGITGISLEFADQTSSGSLEAGALGTIDAKIDTQAWKLRVGHSFGLGETPVYVYGELPMTDRSIESETAKLLQFEGDSGIGDLALAAAIWPYANQDAGRYWGLAGYVVAPVGGYETERNLEGVNLNPGGNRWIGILQTGIHQRFGERWHWSLGSDITFFEDNDKVHKIVLPAGREVVRQEVEPYITYQTSLAWQVLPALTLAASYYVDRGGESRIDGADWGSAVNRERYGLWVMTALSRQTRLNFSYKSTVDNESDFELKDNFQVRLIRFF